MKTFFEKIAVFDLDGTIWAVNSHIDILNRYYHTNFYSSLLFRGLSKTFPKLCLALINKKYFGIPKSYIKQYRPPFRKEVLKSMEELSQKGFKILIISNAPYDIVESAAKRLHTDFLVSKVSHKYRELCYRYTFDFLFVCTDNITDIDLLDHANQQVIYAKHKNRAYFKKRYPKAFFPEDV